MALTLYIGNKNYSSWSFRPWIGMKATGIAFEEVLIPLYEPGSAEKIRANSPAGKVPILIDGAVSVWESLPILEYLAEKFPDKKLWPTDPAARAHARSVSGEMHSSFQAMRKECPMNMWRPVIKRALGEDAARQVARIDAIWSDCLSRYGGPFLFGAFGAADAMYAPVVSRFHTYALPASTASQGYMKSVMALTAFREWHAAGIKEPWVIPHDELDWPQVLKA